MAVAFRNVGTEARLGIHALDNGKSRVCHMGQNRDRAEQSRGVVDQIEKCRKTGDPKTRYRSEWQRMDFIVYSILRAEGHDEREYEQSHRVSDHIVSQQ